MCLDVGDLAEAADPEWSSCSSLFDEYPTIAGPHSLQLPSPDEPASRIKDLSRLGGQMLVDENVAVCECMADLPRRKRPLDSSGVDPSHLYRPGHKAHYDGRWQVAVSRGWEAMNCGHLAGVIVQLQALGYSRQDQV